MISNRAFVCITSLIGGLIYAYFAFFYRSEAANDQFGRFVYNYYFLSLMQGKFDIPAQIIGLEGHYDESGRAFVYHGIAPVITRVFAAPFVDLTKLSLAPFTVWFFATSGTLVYNIAFFRALKASSSDKLQHSNYLIFLVSILIWFVSPGLLLAVNDSLYQEPVSVAYFTMACTVALIVVTAYEGGNWNKTLIFISVLAGITVIARPHVAIGLYLGVVVLSIYLVKIHGRKAIPYVAIAIIILGLFGSIILAINAIRFGDPFTMHGKLHSASLEVGVSFFGFRPINLAFAEHGRFNLSRIIPNLMLYLGDFPQGLLPNYHNALHEAYSYLTSNLGFIRNENPNIGILFIWAPWFLLIATGLSFKKQAPKGLWIAMFITGTVLLLMASYATVTFRYRFELWPFLVVIFCLSIPGLIEFNKRKSKFVSIYSTFIRLFITCTIVFNFFVAANYNRMFSKQGYFSEWSYEQCAKLVEFRSPLGKELVPQICVLTSK